MRIEELEIGDELVCISPEYFKDKSMDKKVLDYLSVPMKVLVVNKFITLISDDNHFALTVFPKELKYFKKKEEKEKPSDLIGLNELIDVAVQAYKDGLIKNLDIRHSFIEFSDEKERYNYAAVVAAKGINFIQSLYKETFVIKSIEDIRRIKNSANIKLSNGNRIERAVHENKGDYVVFNDSNDDFYTFDFVVLKGATVEQERGRND